ncbi:MAG: hypothetical protein KKF48_05010 [Nanoarchaeota archaeon]|nr:hypothetical protein [Nanoarchaeota archaeon]MBU1028377.1 hypothetical protein [Nanoarchaeota archaeon]
MKNINNKTRDEVNIKKGKRAGRLVIGILAGAIILASLSTYTNGCFGVYRLKNQKEVTTHYQNSQNLNNYLNQK